MSKFKHSWLLLKSSLMVLGRNKQLLVFPSITFLCTTVIILFFLAPPLFRPTGYSYVSGEHWQAISHSLFSESTDHAGGHRAQVNITSGAAIYFTVIYFVAMFIATFCNVAFYHEILAALGGQSVSIGRGLKFASTKLKSILMWSAFAGLVGWLIRAIEQRLPLVGRIVGSLLGIAWSVAAVFAIPVIVRDEQNDNPVAVLRKSAGVLTRTWGETLIGYVGLAFANGVILVGSVFWLFSAIAFSIFLKNFWIAGGAVATWLIALFAWSYVAGVASHVYRGSLYLYAAEGILAEPYDREMLDMAWKHKKS